MPTARLFDCFTLNNELDLLELRFRLGAPYVTTFVVVEAPMTFSGKPKPLHFEANRDRFSEWKDQIRHVIVDDMPRVDGDRWAAEVHQRNALLRGLHDAADSDVVVVSDVDELVHPELLASLPARIDGLTGLEMPSTFRCANWELPLGNFALAARAIRFGDLHDPHRQRNFVKPEHVIRDAGRHLTYLGGWQETIAKYESYAHSEFDNDQDKSLVHIERACQLGVDLMSKQLVKAVPQSRLCGIQLELLGLRPDLFNFELLPPLSKRVLFRWYALWRARQPAGSDRVAWFDRQYEQGRPWAAGAAFLEMLRTTVYSAPRLGARAAKRRILRSE